MKEISSSKSGFIAYQEYTAIKRHFTTKYDYFKYNGKTRLSIDNFNSRNDSYYFHKLSKKRFFKELILSNVVLNPKIWVGELFQEEAHENYLSWKKKTDSMTQHISDNLRYLKDNSLKENFISKDGDYPYVVFLYLQKQLSLETLTIMAKITNSTGYWNQNVSDTVIFPDILTKIEKYHPFLLYSPEKIKKVIKTHFF